MTATDKIQTKQAKTYMTSYITQSAKDAVETEARRRGVAMGEVVEDLIEAARAGRPASWGPTVQPTS